MQHTGKPLVWIEENVKIVKTLPSHGRIQKPQRSLHPNMFKLNYTFTYEHHIKVHLGSILSKVAGNVNLFLKKMYYKLVKAFTS